MSVDEVVGSAGGGLRAGCSVTERGAWLVAERGWLDRREARWLEELGRFDAEAGWSIDGQLSGVAWLMWRTGMARPTAYEKLRIARQLHRRDGLAAAFGGGEISYSAVRAISRIDPDSEAAALGVSLEEGEVDRALIELARVATVADVERAVRHVQLLADQERPPADPDRHRGLRVRRHGDGTATIEVTVTGLEADEFDRTLAAFVRPAGRCDSSAGDTPAGPDGANPASDPDPVERGRSLTGERPVPWAGAGSSAGDTRSWPAVRADGFVDLVRTALAHAGGGHAMGADRYLVHLVATAPAARTGVGLTRADGSPVEPGDAGQILCDASLVPAGLDLGRRQRSWSTGQHRWIRVRDGQTCRFPGCDRQINDIHHLLPWAQGGTTDVANGLLACRRHHRLLHHGYTASGTAEGTLTFHRPDGTPLGTTSPRRSRAPK